jgi:NADH-quinone oxidoreductase subunit L
LLLLAVPSVVIGYLTIQPMLFGDFLADAIFINAEAHPAMAKFAEIFHGPLAMVGHAFSTPPLYLAAGGALTAWYMYMVNPALPAAIGRALRPIVTVLENKYYMDWFNENVLARGARALGVGLWKGGDQGCDRGGRGQRQLEAGGRDLGRGAPRADRVICTTTRWS